MSILDPQTSVMELSIADIQARFAQGLLTCTELTQRLLQRIERFQGIAILSTNRKCDIDAGFLRRIRFVIDFLPPGPAERSKLWASALPEKSPSGEVLCEALDWSGLAEHVALTGAEMKLAQRLVTFNTGVRRSGSRVP